MGTWLAEGGTGKPVHVVNPDHVSRLLSEGYQVTPNPNTVEEKKDDDTNGRIAAVRANAAHKSSKGRVDAAH